MVYFDANCAACNITIDDNINVKGIRVFSGFSGSISQAATKTITVGSRDWQHAGGTFNGGDSLITMEKLTLNGGTFNSTAGTLQLGWNATSSSPNYTVLQITGGTFNHNSGTVNFAINGSSGLSPSFVVDVNSTLTLNAVTVDGAFANPTYPAHLSLASGDTINVLGNLVHNDGWLDGGTWDVDGQLQVSNTSDGGTATIVFNDPVSDQTYVCTGGSTASVQVALGGGVRLLPSGTTCRFRSLNIVSGEFVAPTANFYLGYAHNASAEVPIMTMSPGAVFTHNGGTIVFAGGSTSALYLPSFLIDLDGLVTFNHVIFDGRYYSPLYERPFRIGTGDTLAVEGTLLLNYGSTSDGALEARGDVLLISTYDGGNSPLSFKGSALQTLTVQSGGVFPTGASVIDNTNGVQMNSNWTLSGAGQSLSIMNGFLDLQTFTLNVNGNLDVSAGADIVCSTGSYTAGSTSGAGFPITCPNSF